MVIQRRRVSRELAGVHNAALHYVMPANHETELRLLPLKLEDECCETRSDVDTIPRRHIV